MRRQEKHSRPFGDEIHTVPGDNPEDSRKNERIFDDPKFPTTVYKPALEEGRARTLDCFPLLMPDGTGGFRPATGIGQLDSDDGAWSPAGVGADGFNEYSQIPRDAFGIDAETGRLVQRLVPADTDYSAIDYEHGRDEVSELRRVIAVEPDSGRVTAEYVCLQANGAKVDKIGDAVFNPHDYRFVVIDSGSTGQYLISFDKPEGIALVPDGLIINFDNDVLSVAGRPDNMMTHLVFE